MASTFTLWDLDAGNLVGAFETEAAARAVAERALADQGPASIESLALVHEDEQAKLTTIAEGLALVHEQDQPAAPGENGVRSTQTPSRTPGTSSERS
jgi:hypothetical protein